jgi:hypothetical protein
MKETKMPKQEIKTFCNLIILLTILIGWPSLSYADSKMDGEKIVQGKIGIEIINNGKSTLARKRNRITTHDQLKVYALTKFKPYNYVISSNKKNAILLTRPSSDQAEAGEDLKTFPGSNEYYKFDKNSDIELITVICSPKELKEIGELFNSVNVSHEKWEALEKELIQKSKVLENSEVEKPTQIAGHVQQGMRALESFVDKISLRRGNSFLIKKYEFQIYVAKE